VLYGALLSLALVGLLSPGVFNLAPAEAILEGAFVLATCLCLSRFDPAARSIMLVALAYLSTKVALMAFSGSSAWLDFIQAYKAWFYLPALVFFVRRRLFDGPRLARVTALLLAAFFVKYSYSQVLGLTDRPGLYDENNFELVMLLGLVYLAFPYAGRGRHLMFVVLTAIVLLSGSRSASLALLVVYVSTYLRSSNRLWPLHLFGVIGVGAAVVGVFISRDPEGLQTVDRYNFLEIFLREVHHWPIWEFVTGSYPITPLSPASCADLAFYKNVFSHSTQGVCYSVILHSYLLRALFDQGVLGLVLLYALHWMALSRSNASRRDAICLLVLMTFSGLSVSAFNNVYATIVLAIALGLNRDGGPWSRGPAYLDEPARRHGVRPQREAPTAGAARHDGPPRPRRLPVGREPSPGGG
jgi:hypothetical protein